MTSLIFLIIYLITSICSFIEMNRFKNNGHAVSPFLILVGHLFLWILIYPYYILKYREEAIDSAIEWDQNIDVFIKKDNALLLYIFSIILIVYNYSTAIQTNFSDLSINQTSQESYFGSSKTETIRTTANEIYNDYNENEAFAQLKYSEKQIIIDGNVEDIDLDLFDNPTIQLKTDSLLGMVIINGLNQQDASTISRGYNVTFLCNNVSEIGGYPNLDSCSIFR
jgi:hypothetical protein